MKIKSSCYLLSLISSKNNNIKKPDTQQISNNTFESPVYESTIFPHSSSNLNHQNIKPQQYPDPPVDEIIYENFGVDPNDPDQTLVNLGIEPLKPLTKMLEEDNNSVLFSDTQTNVTNNTQNTFNNHSHHNNNHHMNIINNNNNNKPGSSTESDRSSRHTTHNLDTSTSNMYKTAPLNRRNYNNSTLNTSTNNSEYDTESFQPIIYRNNNSHRPNKIISHTPHLFYTEVDPESEFEDTDQAHHHHQLADINTTISVYEHSLDVDPTAASALGQALDKNKTVSLPVGKNFDFLKSTFPYGRNSQGKILEENIGISKENLSDSTESLDDEHSLTHNLNVSRSMLRNDSIQMPKRPNFTRTESSVSNKSQFLNELEVLKCQAKVADDFSLDILNELNRVIPDFSQKSELSSHYGTSVSHNQADHENEICKPAVLRKKKKNLGPSTEQDRDSLITNRKVEINSETTVVTNDSVSRKVSIANLTTATGHEQQSMDGVKLLSPNDASHVDSKYTSMRSLHTKPSAKQPATRYGTSKSYTNLKPPTIKMEESEHDISFESKSTNMSCNKVLQKPSFYFPRREVCGSHQKITSTSSYSINSSHTHMSAQTLPHPGFGKKTSFATSKGKATRLLSLGTSLQNVVQYKSPVLPEIAPSVIPRTNSISGKDLSSTPAINLHPHSLKSPNSRRLSKKKISKAMSQKTPTSRKTSLSGSLKNVFGHLGSTVSGTKLNVASRTSSHSHSHSVQTLKYQSLSKTEINQNESSVNESVCKSSVLDSLDREFIQKQEKATLGRSLMALGHHSNSINSNANSHTNSTSKSESKSLRDKSHKKTKSTSSLRLGKFTSSKQDYKCSVEIGHPTNLKKISLLEAVEFGTAETLLKKKTQSEVLTNEKNYKSKYDKKFHTLHKISSIDTGVELNHAMTHE